MSPPRAGVLRRIVPAWRRLPRWMQLLVLAMAAAVVVDAALIAAMSLRRPPPPPLSPVFPSGTVIRELQQMAAEQPEDPEWQVRLGQAYLEDGHFLSAIDALETALRLGGPEREIRWALAASYSSVDRNHEAVTHLERLARSEPNNLQVQVQMAAEYLRLQQPGRARQILDSIPPDASGYFPPGDSAAQYAAIERVASAYSELNAWDRSLALLRPVLRDAPDRDGAHLAAGQALVGLQRPAAAVVHLRLALRAQPNDPDRQFLLAQALMDEHKRANDPEAARLLEPIAGGENAPGEAFFQLGLIYERQRKWERAARAFARAHHLRSNTVQSLLHASQDFHKAGLREDGIYMRGLYFETLRQFPKAITEFQKLTRIHSCCHSGYMHIARVQKEIGDVRLALRTLQTASKILDAPPKLYAELAQAYDAVRDLKNEQAVWWEFIRRDPANADVGYQNLGALADGAGKLDEAEQMYRKCVELQPDADLYRVRLARLLLQRRNDQARLREAIAHLERAVTLVRNYADSYFHLGISYRYAGRNLEAIWALRHAIDLDPGDGKAYQPLGELLIAAGKTEEGKRTLGLFTRYREFFQTWETLRARANRNPRDLDAQRRLAAFYDHTKAQFDAINAYARVLELKPGDPHASQRIAQLYRELGQDLQGLRELRVDRTSRPAKGRGGAR